MKNSSIARNVGVLKFFGRWLLENGFAVGDVSDFDVRLKWTNGAGKAVIFLEWSELSALLAAADGGVFGGTPGAVVDMFLFSCFSGLRFSDVSALRVGDVRDGRIRVVTQKTTAALEIELNQYTKKIYDKYIGVVGGSPDLLLFPPHTSQTCNRELKVCFRRLGLCRMVEKISFCGSERLQISAPLCDVVSFHAARRTFVVECLRRGIAPAVIMKWTGHSDYSAMKPYIEIVDSLKSSEMSKFDT
jgi:integrase